MLKTTATLTSLMMLVVAALPFNTFYEYEVTVTVLSSEALTTLQTADKSIDIIGSWSKPLLQVYIQSSGLDVLDTAAKKGVDVWYGGIRAFTDEYGYTYLLNLRYTYVLRESEADVSISFVDTLGREVCGLTSLRFNSITRAVSRATIQISRSCVGNSAALAYKVVAHEYGHALGLGHSNYEADLMFDYINTADLPSTLNLYALALAYRWLAGSSYTTPSQSTVILPNEIPYKYVPPVPEMFKVRVIAVSDLGRTVLYDSQTLRGSLFTYEVNQLIDFGNGTRLSFEGWFVNGVRVENTPSLQYHVNSDVDLIANYGVYYRVSVKKLDGFYESWVRRGENLQLETAELLVISENTRLKFAGWSDGNMEPKRTITVTSPVDLEAFYVKEYRLDVITPFNVIEGTGWYREGSTARVRVLQKFVYEKAGERYRFMSLNSSIQLKQVGESIFELNVTQPVTLTSTWVKELHVQIKSSHGPSLLDKWVLENSEIGVKAPQTLVWENKTKAVFIGWAGLETDSPNVTLIVKTPINATAHYKIFYWIEVDSPQPVKTSSGWYERGTYIVLDAGPIFREFGRGLRYRFLGWVGPGNISQQLLVDRPSVFKAEWVLEASIKVVKHSSVVEFWRKLGETITVEAEPLIQPEPDRRYVFITWEGPIEDSYGAKAVVKVDGPKTLKAVYREEVLIQPSFISRDGENVNAYAVLKISDGETVELHGGMSYWIPVGEHEIVSVFFKEVDVKVWKRLPVAQPGRFEVPVKVYNLVLKVRDVLGIPFIGSKITLKNSIGIEAVAVIENNGYAYFPQTTFDATKATLSSQIFSYDFTVPQEAGEVAVVLPITPITTIILLAALLSASTLLVKHLEKKRLRILS